MFPQDFESDFTLDRDEYELFIVQCMDIASEILGDPVSSIAREVREKRLQDGTYAKIGRNTIRPSKEHVGYVINFILFTPLATLNRDDSCITYDGDYFELTVDLIGRTTYRIQGNAEEEIDEFGEGDLAVGAMFEVVRDSDDESDNEVNDCIFNEQFSPLLIDGSDQLKIMDIKHILLS